MGCPWVVNVVPAGICTIIDGAVNKYGLSFFLVNTTTPTLQMNERNYNYNNNKGKAKDKDDCDVLPL